MLRACLESLIVQRIPAGWKIGIIVIDNEAKPAAQAIVSEVGEKSALPIIYAHEPRKGISFARNRALETALGLEASWIAFIDDDEVAENNWLSSLIIAAQETGADVVHGLTKYDYPAPCLAWMPQKKRRSKKTGDLLDTCSTNNVLFHAGLINATGLGLRFDESLALTGGEDTDFFYRARDKGAQIVYTTEAIVTESVPEERCSYAWRMKRYYRTSANSARTEMRRKGYWNSFPHLTLKFLRNLSESILLFLLLPFLIFFYKKSFRQYLYKAGRRLASAMGIIAAYFGRLPKPYMTVDGY